MSGAAAAYSFHVGGGVLRLAEPLSSCGPRPWIDPLQTRQRAGGVGGAGLSGAPNQ